ncbi:MAG: LamG-like jellyroll fold domain-containing protein [Egibacteraceae bacterium]
MRRIGVAVLLLSIAVLLLPAGRVLAGSAAGLWHMEDPGKMVDSSGQGNDGDTTDIESVPGIDGRGYRFNGTTSFVEVASTDSLNPGGDDVELTVHMRFDQVPGTDFDVIRKGLGDTEGGEYKMQVAPTRDGTAARANCTFHGSNDDGKVSGDRDVADGAWHSVRCIKTKNAIEIVVDGEHTVQRVQIGKISNDEPLTVGAKSFPDDQFRGDMDEVSVRIG